MKTTNKDLEYIIRDNMGQYSTYVLLSRAIPDFRDGLKPSYRRALWAMHEMKATRFTKSANIAGEVMRYHPHGSTYPTMVGMAQTDGQLNPFIIGKGNFGQHASELAFASDRYTEMKLSDISVDMMADVKKDGVDFVDNYDGTRKIPEVFPVKYPTILAYAQSGIGVGFSSSIPSFNTTELCEAIIKRIEDNEETLLIPDFGTGAYIINDSDVIKSINEDGSGSINQRAKVEFDKDSREIIVKEIPYATTKEKIIERIIKLSKEDKLKEIVKVEDTSGLKGLEIIITAKRGIDLEQLLEKLYQMTPMQASYSTNMMVINREGLPEKTGVWSLIDKWLEWRTDTYQRMITKDIKTKQVQLEILYGLKNIKDDLEHVIKIIRNSTDDNVIQNLSDEFNLTKLQSERVSGLKLKNLTTTFIKKQLGSIKSLEKEIEQLEWTVEKPQRIHKLIVQDMKDVIAQFGTPRKSELIDKTTVANKAKLAPVNIVDEYNVKVIVTKDGYVKKIPLTSLRGNSEIQFKEGDFAISELDTTNDEELLIFTNQQNVYKKQLNDLNDTKPKDLGNFMPSLIDLEKGEEISGLVVLSKDTKYILLGFDDGKVAKVSVEAYRTSTKRSKLKNGVSDKTVILLSGISDDVDLLSISNNGKAVVTNTSMINPKSSKSTQGATNHKLKDGDTIESLTILTDDIDVDKEYYRVQSAGAGKNYKG
ncbi:MAG: DNA topoisomerase (ATP-hydrolyzing) subunit A [Lactococcus hircilactis]